jgi:very-short-patch-repair endonuclease
MRTAEIKTTVRARSLRQVDNEAEAALWSELRARRLNGYKFVRQLPISRYFADFACREEMLVVEVDGSQHADNSYDRERDAVMAELGWSVLRVWNVDVLMERMSVLDTIVAALEGRLEAAASRDLRFVLGRKFDGVEI